VSGQWKPGDVATSDHAGISVVVPKCDKHFAGGPHWHHMSGGWDYLDDVLSRGKFRPLVVIDPENREAVERFAAAYRDVSGEADLTDEPWSIPGLRMQAALRSLIAPPKPEEPTGLGAVVEDARGQVWVRTNLLVPWVSSGETRVSWDALSAVKVLSPGVTP
jgi:hypothetical protein